MREIQKDLELYSYLPSNELIGKLDRVVWEKYESLKAEGYFQVTVLKFIKIDISGKIEELLTRWFGQNPYGKRIKEITVGG